MKMMLRANQTHKKHPNKVDRNFSQGASKKFLLTDSTYITYRNDKRAYLSALKDSTTRMILAQRLSNSLDLQFVFDTIKQLHDVYKDEYPPDILIHSDQGIHSTSVGYQSLLKALDLGQSMSRKGNCWDNAFQESFFSIIKTEVNLKQYKSVEEAALGITDYINDYNDDRPQEGLYKMTPHE